MHDFLEDFRCNTKILEEQVDIGASRSIQVPGPMPRRSQQPHSGNDTILLCFMVQ